MRLFDRLKARLGGGAKVDEVVQAMEDEDAFTGNRAYARAWKRSQRLKGPGYTRSYRKGRKQRTLYVPEEDA